MIQDNTILVFNKQSNKFTKKGKIASSSSNAIVLSNIS